MKVESFGKVEGKVDFTILPPNRLPQLRVLLFLKHSENTTRNCCIATQSHSPEEEEKEEEEEQGSEEEEQRGLEEVEERSQTVGTDDVSVPAEDGCSPRGDLREVEPHSQQPSRIAFVPRDFVWVIITLPLK